MINVAIYAYKFDLYITFYELKKYEDTSYADSLRPRGGQRPPRPLPIDARDKCYGYPRVFNVFVLSTRCWGEEQQNDSGW